MASTLVKSLRIAPELWAWVERRAEEVGASANGLAVRCIEDARDRVSRTSDAEVDEEFGPAKVVARRDASKDRFVIGDVSGPMGTPGVSDTTASQPTSPSVERRHEASPDSPTPKIAVPYGPVARPAGSMLIDKRRGKR